jgi:hypothetical protein
VKNIYRIVFALTVLLSGVALAPVVGLPQAAFHWQRYAGVYTPQTLQINHLSGMPGSFFTVSGMNFTPNEMVSILANGTALGDVTADQDGNLLFIIDSTGAQPGYYRIEAGAGGPFVQFQLDPQEVQWPQEGSGPVLTLPADSALQVIFLPHINR